MNVLRKTALAALVAAGIGFAGAAVAQDQTYTIGVSVPTADHGWTGGIDFFAQQATERLSKIYPNVKFVLAQAPDSTKQAADLEDMVTTRNIDALVILPGDPDAMTASIKKVKDAGKWVTIVDRELSQPGIPNLYVAGDNPGLGATTAAYFKEAMPNGGNIRVTRNRRGGEMHLAVSDTGAGIPEDIQDKVFNPFFTTKEHGSGLGLAKVFTIVESHRGRVEFTSAHGKGTTFTLAFPLTSETHDDAAHHPAG